ncbi:MAG TPA: SDR family NAD(P)-dependent oxidoreductase [Dehalococcoidia bacterium]|nr:SDR family NAD(P)-dependent oxidoreductase [Dehalococcoidia bacterium]
MQEFEGKVAVVTGAASGMGRAFAERFAQEGMKVVLADVEEGALELAVTQLRQQEHDVIGVLTDVSKAASVEHLRDEALKAYGKVHVLCNNAGVSGGNGSPGSIIWDASLKDWEWLTAVNYFGVAYGIHYFVPLMIAQDEEGHVVNTASAAGITPGNGVYGATKHAVVSMSESLYRDFHRMNTKLGVTCLCPGVVNTGIIRAQRNRPVELQNEGEALFRPPEEMARIAAWAAAGKQPPEIAEMVVQAIRDNRLYLITHHDHDEIIADWADAIVNRRNPTPFPPRPRVAPNVDIEAGGHPRSPR